VQQCWVIEIGSNPTQLSQLEHLEVIPYDITSWRYKSRSPIAFLDLLRKDGVITDDPSNPVYPVVASVDNPIHGDQEIQDIGLYFFKLIKNALELLGIESIVGPNAPYVIAINLWPFHTRSAIADRLAGGIMRAVAHFPKLAGTSLVLFVRIHKTFSESVELSRLIQSPNYPSKIYIIDRDGYSIMLERNVDPEAAGPKLRRHIIGHSVFDTLLNFPDKESFRSQLIYQTNMNIGHFDVGSCHVRTHYDLTDFVRRDSVFQHLYKELRRVTHGFKKVNVITTGFEIDALMTLANRIQDASARDYQVENGNGSKKVEFFWIGHLSGSDLKAYTGHLEKLVGDSDCLLILTDVVNSGSTVEEMSKALEQIREGMDSSSHRPIDPDVVIKVFAVVKMRNSPPSIEAAVTIERPYFKIDDKTPCPLCQMKQPIAKVGKETWNKDFKYVDRAQLTPFDFWETVQDCKALETDKLYAGGFRLLHRVSTKRVLERYKHWLVNVIRARYASEWGTQYPSTLFFVDEPSGESFANLTMEALYPHRCVTVKVTREVVSGRQEISDKTTNSLTACRQRGDKVLIVDDGINTGGTISRLISFVTRHDIKPMGVLVFDNRLQEVQIRHLENEMSGAKVIALYTWPARPLAS